MSVFKSKFEKVLKEKFGSGYSFNEWYQINSDSINYDIQFQGNTGRVSITGLEEIKNSGSPIELLMREKLDEQFP